MAALFMAGFGRLVGRRWGTLLAILGIGLYTVLVGASASVLRAALMGSLALFARQFGRQTGVNSLAITAGVMAAVNPYTLWDPGFQLSFGATLGLLLADAGSAASNPPEWIANLRPQAALIGISPADLQDLPAPETLALLQGYTVLRTDRDGWIELTTDGQQMWVKVERK